MEDEFIEGNKIAKLKFFGIVVLTIIYFVLESFSGLMIDQTDLIIQSSSEKAMRITVDVLLIENVITALILLRLSTHIIKLGLSIKNSGQLPPPGTKVPFKTKIRRGNYAKYGWILCFVFAGFLIVKPSLDFYVWHKINEIPKGLDSTTYLDNGIKINSNDVYSRIEHFIKD